MIALKECWIHTQIDEAELEADLAEDEVKEDVGDEAKDDVDDDVIDEVCALFALVSLNLIGFKWHSINSRAKKENLWRKMNYELIVNDISFDYY